MTPQGQSSSAPAERPSDAPEKVVFSARPSFLFVGIRYALAAALWLVAAALTAWGTTWAGWDIWVGAIIVLLIGILLFIKPGVAHLRRQRHLYTLTNYKIEVQYGLIAKTIRIIPLTKIQDVTVEATVFERLIGIGDVVIDSAAEGNTANTSGGVRFTDIRDPKKYADSVLREMRQFQRGN